MSVKIIPITDDYRREHERIFGRRSSVKPVECDCLSSFSGTDCGQDVVFAPPGPLGPGFIAVGEEVA